MIAAIAYIALVLFAVQRLYAFYRFRCPRLGYWGSHIINRFRR